VQTRLAQVRFAAGDTSGAVAELKSASATDAQDYQADLALVAAYLRQRDADKALEALTALEKKQPQNPLTHNLRALALLLKRDYAGARASYEHAVELQPNFIPAIRGLAQLDLRDKKPEEARKRYEALLKKEPNNEQALFDLSVLLRVTGAGSQEIEKLLRQAVAGNPTSVGARASLINFYVRSRDSKAALAAAQEAQAALPNNAAVLRALGVTQLTAGETRQAIASFGRLAELASRSCCSRARTSSPSNPTMPSGRYARRSRCSLTISARSASSPGSTSPMHASRRRSARRMPRAPKSRTSRLAMCSKAKCKSRRRTGVRRSGPTARR
jgi:tetratricopeptide (TPR) repeat protein